MNWLQSTTTTLKGSSPRGIPRYTLEGPSPWGIPWYTLDGPSPRGIPRYTLDGPSTRGIPRYTLEGPSPRGLYRDILWRDRCLVEYTAIYSERRPSLWRVIPRYTLRGDRCLEKSIEKRREEKRRDLRDVREVRDVRDYYYCAWWVYIRVIRIRSLHTIPVYFD